MKLDSVESGSDDDGRQGRLLAVHVFEESKLRTVVMIN